MAFFSEVQRWFSAGFDGRYIGKIILEWQKEDRAGFIAFIHKQLGIKLPSGFRLEAEFGYKPGHERRAADLAIFPNAYDVMPLVLIEIKWDDKPIEDRKTGRAQLKDYVKYCRLHKACNLLVLTKDALRVDELDQIGELRDRGQHCYFGNLFPHLEESGSGVAKMLLDFLQDKGVIVNNIDRKALFQFFHRFVNPYGGSNHKVSEDQLSNGPDQFKNMLNNMRLIAQDISPEFFEVKGMNRKATVDFSFFPYFSQGELSKALIKIKDEDENDEVALDPKARTGGEIYIHAAETICRSPWTQIEYGFCFTVEPSKSQDLSVSVYALVKGAKIKQSDTYTSQEGAAVKKCVYDGKKKNEIVNVFKSEIKKAISSGINKKLVKPKVAHQLKIVLKGL